MSFGHISSWLKFLKAKRSSGELGCPMTALIIFCSADRSLFHYNKCPKISYTVSDKMAYANSADPNQAAPEGAI